MGIDYYHEITTILQGKTSRFETVPAERLDWGPSSAVLAMYGATSGNERNAMIHAMAQIVADAKESPAVIAQILHIAASLDIAQIEPSVGKLEATEQASQEPVRSAIKAYRAFRELKSLSYR